MRHLSFILIDRKFFKLPFNFSKLLEGGAFKSISESAASINNNFINARFWISAGNFFEITCSKTSFVSLSPKDLII
jgi:hypothetical protein